MALPLRHSSSPVPAALAAFGQGVLQGHPSPVHILCRQLSYTKRRPENRLWRGHLHHTHMPCQEGIENMHFPVLLLCATKRPLEHGLPSSHLFLRRTSRQDCSERIRFPVRQLYGTKRRPELRLSPSLLAR